MILNPIQFLAGLVISLGIGAIAYRRQWLTGGGVLGAVLIGTLTFGLGGLSWAMVVVAFFVSSSLLTHYRSVEKHEASAEFEKGGRRDFLQVMANGGVSAALAVALVFLPQAAHILFAAFVGALATVTADTWATELGMLSRDPPRLITNWQPARSGESGAVSVLGLIAAATGALLVGSIGLLGKFIEGLFVDEFVSAWSWLPTAALFAGVVGSVADSMLGATVQAMYYCPTDDTLTEKAIHRCGRAAIHLRGLLWMNNDMVNFLASILGALCGAGVYFAIGR